MIQSLNMLNRLNIIVLFHHLFNGNNMVCRFEFRLSFFSELYLKFLSCFSSLCFFKVTVNVAIHHFLYIFFAPLCLSSFFSLAFTCSFVFMYIWFFSLIFHITMKLSTGERTLRLHVLDTANVWYVLCISRTSLLFGCGSWGYIHFFRINLSLDAVVSLWTTLTNRALSFINNVFGHDGFFHEP